MFTVSLFFFMSAFRRGDEWNPYLYVVFYSSTDRSPPTHVRLFQIEVNGVFQLIGIAAA